MKDFDEIRRVLHELAEPARAEAATGFDPSGLGCLAEPEGLRLDGSTSVSGNGASWNSPADYATSVSDFSEQSENARFTDQTNLSDAQKVQELRMIFGERFPEHTVKFILKQAKGDLERAFEELLNRQYLEESGSLLKGIDGFFAPDEGQQLPSGRAARAHKPKTKGKRLSIEYKAVSPTVDDAELEGAKDFAPPGGSRATGATRRLPASPPAARRSVPTSPVQPTAAAAAALPTASELAAANRRAAAALRRLGPLGRQGAVVYAERAREEQRAFATQASLFADAHVDQQSTDTMLDLHGVFVLDGVRITRQRVWAWWNGLGENRRAAAKKNGFTVVTGKGKHSAGGVSRLRQAVGAYLKNDGWKVETLSGSFYVTGRV